MTRFTVYGKHLTRVELATLKSLAAEAAQAGDDVQVVTSIGEPDPSVANEVVLMLGTPATCESVDLTTDLEAVANGTRRTIWIWPDGSEAKELPASAGMYSYSAIPCDAKKLRAVAADDDVMYFETPSGGALPKANTERNICVEEKKAKAK